MSESEPTMLEQADRYAPVLQWVHQAFEQPEMKLKPVGELVRLGCSAHSLPYPSGETERALLLSAVKLAMVPYTTVSA